VGVGGGVGGGGGGWRMRGWVLSHSSVFFAREGGEEGEGVEAEWSGRTRFLGGFGGVGGECRGGGGGVGREWGGWGGGYSRDVGWVQGVCSGGGGGKGLRTVIVNDFLSNGVRQKSRTKRNAPFAYQVTHKNARPAGSRVFGWRAR